MDQPDDDDAWLREHVRIHEDASGVSLQACIIEWPGSHTPVARWEVVRHWSAAPAAEEIAAATNALLDDKRYFRTCATCQRRLPRGHMHDAKICHGCAEKFLGVVHRDDSKGRIDSFRLAQSSLRPCRRTLALCRSERRTGR